MKKISKLFLLRDRKGVASHGQCIVGLYEPKEQTHMRHNKDKVGIRPWYMAVIHLTGAHS